MRPCALDDLDRQTQPFTDCKGIGAPRHSGQQTVGRPQSSHIKLAARIFDAFSIERKHLDLCVMGGSNYPGPLRSKLFNYRDRQCRAFDRIGPRAQLIQQDQRLFVCLLQNPDDIGHMRREGREALFNALLVTDVD